MHARIRNTLGTYSCKTPGRGLHDASVRAAVDLTRQLRGRQCVRFGLVHDDLHLLLLFRVQDLRKVFVELWLLLLQFCAWYVRKSAENVGFQLGIDDILTTFATYSLMCS